MKNKKAVSTIGSYKAYSKARKDGSKYYEMYLIVKDEDPFYLRSFDHIDDFRSLVDFQEEECRCMMQPSKASTILSSQGFINVW